MSNRKKGKARKILLWILVCLVALTILLSLTNYLCCLSEKSKITDYGTKIEVTGGTMCVGIYGSGDDVVVLLPGWSVQSSVFTFKNLTELLSEKCTVVVPEPFGYGLSDMTDRERSFTNKANELHECLSSLGYTSYVLMGHSLSGITMLEYSNLYPDEVTAVIALDTSVPKQTVWTSKWDNIKTDILVYGLKCARATGIIRLYYALGGTLGIPEYLSAEETETMKYLTMSPALLNENMMDEIDYFNNVDSIRLFNTKYPDEIPVLTFLAEENVDYLAEWEPSHIEISDNARSRVEVLSGGHDIYNYHPEEIAEKTIEFITIGANPAIVP